MKNLPTFDEFVNESTNFKTLEDQDIEKIKSIVSKYKTVNFNNNMMYDIEKQVDCRVDYDNNHKNLTVASVLKNGISYIIGDSKYITNTDWTINGISGGPAGQVKPTIRGTFKFIFK